MAEMTKNFVPIAKIEEIVSNTGNEYLRCDVSKALIRDRDKIDFDSQNDAVTSNFTCENAEWKYKNLYSIIASPGNGHPTGWASCRAAALANAIHSKRLDENENERKMSYIVRCREYLADYQEFYYGVPRTEYTFSALIKVMGQATGRSLLALLYVIVNIIPMSEILLNILRFLLDKATSLKNTSDLRQVPVKYAVFGLQLLFIYICLVFIFGFIVMPILHMTFMILVKIMLYY